ncbi:unnamed protein product [Caenorhabditis brenneri]
MAPFTIILVAFLLLDAGFLAFDGEKKSSSLRSMFYNVGYIEVVDARRRLGLHMPSINDTYNTWFRMKKSTNST